MFRRMVLSIFGGALFAVALTFSQTAMGACQHQGINWCADTLPYGQVFDSCLVTYTCPAGESCYISDTKCFYTSEPIIID
jgi:hypothetical protein